MRLSRTTAIWPELFWSATLPPTEMSSKPLIPLDRRMVMLPSTRIALARTARASVLLRPVPSSPSRLSFWRLFVFVR